MSTSDPQATTSTPSGAAEPPDEEAAPTAPADDGPVAGTGTGTGETSPVPPDAGPGTTGAAATGGEPTAEPPTTTPAPSATPATTSVPTTPAATDEPVTTDTGRHAVARPVPEPPDGPAPARTTTTAVPVASTGGATATGAPEPAAPAPAPADAPAAPTAEPAAEAPAAGPSTTRPAPHDPGLFPDPNAPRTPTWGTHVLGVLTALVITPFAIGLTLLGQARILAVQAGAWDASLEVFGIVLVVVGLMLLCALLLLGLWTAAVPITAGAALTLTGGVALVAPGVARRQVLEIISSDAWSLTVTQVTVAGTSGTLVVAGALLLVAGLVTALARRRGVHLGVFRERNRHL